MPALTPVPVADEHGLREELTRLVLGGSMSPRGSRCGPDCIR